MIIIATHNGYDFIGNHVDSWKTHGTDGHRVVAVMTGACEEAYTAYLCQLYCMCYEDGFPLWVRNTHYAGYDTGAYLWALREYPDEEDFLFCHDSMLVKRPGVMNDFRRIARETGAGCVPWLVFRQNGYENEEQIEFVHQFAEDVTLPGFGIFGPIFYATREALEQLDPRFLRAIPKNKNQQEALERGWAVAFARSGVQMVSLDGDFYPPHVMMDAYPTFQKFLPKRQ